MISRYKTCLSPTTHRPYLLHAFKDSDALTVRLLQPASEEQPAADIDLNLHLPEPLQPTRLRDFVSGDALGQPGTRWLMTAGFTFSVSALGGLRPRQSWVIPIDHEGQFVFPFERFSLTETTKQSRSVALRMQNVRQVAMIASAFGASSLDDCQILIVGGAHGHCANFEFSHVLETLTGCEMTGTQTPDFFPRTSIAGPATVAAGRLARFSLSFVDAATGALVSNGSRSVPVRLEATSGYLVDRVVYPRNGQSKFRWKALGMSKGDRLKIKSSWGTWSGDAEIEVRVV